jgi:hypothetical protein
MPPIKLSSQGLERAAPACETNFVLKVHGFEIHCTEFQAAFFSPRVHSLLQQDKTVNSFCIESQSERIDWKRIVGLCEELMKGSAIDPISADLCGQH